MAPSSTEEHGSSTDRGSLGSNPAVCVLNLSQFRPLHAASVLMNLTVFDRHVLRWSNVTHIVVFRHTI